MSVIGRGLTGLAILAAPVLVLLGLAWLLRLGPGFALPWLGVALIAAAAIWMWWDNRERNRNPVYSPQESRRVFARMLGASVAGMVLTLVGITFLFSTFPELLGQPSDDRCERMSSGEPDRGDPDCHDFGFMEAWDRAHPAP